MLINVPDAEELNNVGLRLYFSSWSRTLVLISNFCKSFDVEFSKLANGSKWDEEWDSYLSHAQPELGAICATAQQAAEIRLKSIICQTSPYLLLLNNQMPLKSTNADIEFSDQRTLDAVDLPRVVRLLTNFQLSSTYIEQYGIMRRLRNQVMHLGTHKEALNFRKLVDLLAQQYIALWPDGRWLFRRVAYDGQTTEQFFHDGRMSSVESIVMAELPETIEILDDSVFKKLFGVKKHQIKGYCPNCMFERAAKLDADGHPTAYKSSSAQAICLMCESILGLHVSKKCKKCGSLSVAKMQDKQDEEREVCFGCGQ